MFNRLIIRAAVMGDLDDIERLAQTAYAGLTSLPKRRHLLKHKLMVSIRSFQREVEQVGDEYYLFVMEDVVLKKVVGVCSILASVGCVDPFYSFHIQPIKKQSWCLEQELQVDLLRLEILRNGPSEIGTLFLDPKYREKGIGRFLSLSRFLFIAMHPERFKPSIIAEMRGLSDENGQSPFWEHLGKHFFDMSFSQADILSGQDKSFISELVPKYPIYVNLLPKEAQDVIGRAHVNTLPALRILQSEGFQATNTVDIFDGGPKITAQLSDIRTIRDSHEGHIVGTSDDLGTKERHLIGRGKGADFRVCCAYMKSVHQNEIVIPKHLDRLQHREGELVRFVRFYSSRIPDFIKKSGLEELTLKHQIEVDTVSSKSSFLRRFAQWYKTVSTTSRTSGL